MTTVVYQHAHLRINGIFLLRLLPKGQLNSLLTMPTPADAIFFFGISFCSNLSAIGERQMFPVQMTKTELNIFITKSL